MLHILLIGPYIYVLKTWLDMFINAGFVQRWHASHLDRGKIGVFLFSFVEKIAPVVRLMIPLHGVECY